MTRSSTNRSAMLLLAAPIAVAQTKAAPPAPPSSVVSPVLLSAALRERGNATEWFAATPNSERYGHGDSMLRLGITQRVHHFDYQLELGQSSELELPRDAVSPIAAQGQLGLGGTYYAANNNNPYPVAVSFRQGYLRYHFKRDATTLRLGRFEFFDGQETTPKLATLQWLQTNRIAQRLIGNFGFSNGQRSFDGVEGKVGGKTWDLTAMAGRPIQGVFNMNANPELNVDIQYLAFTRTLAKDHVIARGFALGYHDGRTGLTKTDNRSAAARALDHKNTRIGTYGADVIATAPLGKNTTTDFLLWGVLQNGRWGLLDQHSGGFAVEAGLRFDQVPTKPWIRGGALRTTGDNDSTDGTHNTYFQVLTTPRNYARFPYFNSMNSKDEFVQVLDKPTPKMDIRSDLHFLQLTAPTDLWYQGGGPFDNKVFGYVGRPGNNHGSFSTLLDISADYALTKQVSFTLYYAKVFGKSVVTAIYPAQHNAQYGYFELNYKFSKLYGHS